jgi:peptidoglycan/LPS O-acetylase OafA/YrhL
MKYRADKDGLRAIAIVPVLLYNKGFEAFSVGCIGVNVSFFISGCLITSIIMKEGQENRFTISIFYERRARRNLPVYFGDFLVFYRGGYILCRNWRAAAIYPANIFCNEDCQCKFYIDGLRYSF